ncbi:membrane protein [Actinorhabdospora filicis]|uniref:Membrane protein n=1 Tax=Actinorhabdospora filicis TaxID=1785913 RepID=A0A9W6SDS9_9ACTN|nr:DUF58 domain-containing protein [Actinorhabdospora filicis]GLZ75389.1 membrane protein [Actinorhabdospora filicis]
MRESLRGLTTRGKAFFAAAISFCLVGIFIGEKDLLRVGILIGAMPLLSAFALARTRYKLVSARVLDPQRTEVGHSARVVLRLRNSARLPTGTLMLEDRLPYALGSRPRLVLERLAGLMGSSVSYTVRAEARGRYDVGPLVIRMTDPFGLCEITRSFPTKDKLTVTPKITPLPAIRLAGEYAGSGDSRTRSVAVHGEDDVATREYRYGDDLRRVHWRSTARAGELMVRREEQPWESRATVMLDVRGAGHRGEGPTSSFEWAVGATASIALHLKGHGYKLRMVTETVDIDGQLGGEGEILDHLAEVKLRKHGVLDELVHRARQGEHGGLIIGVVGQLDAAEAERLASLRVSGASCVALLIDSSTWLPLPPPQRQKADEAFHGTVLSLMRAGWKVVPVRRGEDLAHLWPLVGRSGQGFATRAALAEAATHMGTTNPGGTR